MRVAIAMVLSLSLSLDRVFDFLKLLDDLNDVFFANHVLNQHANK